MSTGQSADTERAQVITYVPEEQRTIWEDHADELGLSLSRYVRYMVQSGRRGFLSDNPDTPASHSQSTTQPLEDQVLEILSESEYLDWEDLVGALTGNFEEELENTLDYLQNDNVIRYSGRNGGYKLVGSNE